MSAKNDVTKCPIALHPTVTHTPADAFNARRSTSLWPQPGQVHNSEQDRPLGNAPGRAPAAQTEAKETQLFSCLGHTGGILIHTL